MGIILGTHELIILESHDFYIPGLMGNPHNLR